MSRIVDVVKWGATLGSGEQNFLGARWVRTFLKHAPAVKRREYALKVLALSPHYFLDANDPKYRNLSRSEYVEDAFRRCVASREKIYDQILRERLSPDDVVLDYGCGPGFLAGVLARHVKKVYALDISPGVLACARILNDAPNLEYVVADAVGFAAVPDAGIDTVVSIAMAQHVSDGVLNSVLENCRQKLRPGGRLIMHVHLLEAGWRSESEWKSDTSARGKLKLKYGLNCFGRISEEYVATTAARGFENIAIIPIADIVDEQFDDICSEHLLTAERA